MSLDLGNLLQGQVGDVLGQFLTANGEAAENSTQAAGLAVPAIIAGLVKHVSGNTANASGLLDLITGEGGARLNTAVADVATGNGAGSLIDLGKQLLPDLLGGNAPNVADQIAAESGISKASSGSLLALALPLVLSVLRGKVQSGNLSGSQLLGLLGQQQSWLSRVLGPNMLSALGIGSLSGLFGGLTNVISGLGATGAAATASAANASAAAAAPVAAKKGGAGKWIVLGLAALAALFAFKSCGNKQEPATAPAPVEAGASAASDVAVLAEASARVVASEVAAPAASDATPAVASTTDPVVQEADSAARVLVEDGVAKFYFATGKNDIAEGADAIVAEIIAAGKEGKKLVISGFADSTGNAAANEELSKQRAQAVQAFFEAQGVDAANIELRKPENTTGAVGNEQEGRRVEVKVEG
ncbi:OmpA family protein [Neisseria yangbaofengii]|uniref:OmpA family protein n=1 Tax=Neisseria yangbaofengii TaxID=2709396 RepID=UPI0013EBDC94|nr:OmpA family protein [Neisseria yangbaofengii]